MYTSRASSCAGVAWPQLIPSSQGVRAIPSLKRLRLSLTQHGARAAAGASCPRAAWPLVRRLLRAVSGRLPSHHRRGATRGLRGCLPRGSRARGGIVDRRRGARGRLREGVSASSSWVRAAREGSAQWTVGAGRARKTTEQLSSELVLRGAFVDGGRN